MWSGEATKTLVEVWGDLHIQLNRGSLKQHHWQQVTDAVNRRHGDEFECTDIQAKNRIDTVKKKYKKEKSRVSKSAGKYVSPWPFFHYLDYLVGSPAPASVTTRRRTPTLTLPPTYSIPVRRRTKRPAPPPEPEIFSGDEDLGVRKFEAMAAAARMVAEAEEEKEEGNAQREKERDGNVELREIAVSIERFGDKYERVEKEKISKMIELEKHKMQLAIDLNVQMMNYIAELKMNVDRNERSESKNEKGQNGFDESKL